MPIPSFQDAQSSLANLQDEFNRLIQRVYHGGVSTGPLDGQAWSPSIDLHEFDDRFVLFAEVPGVQADGIDVSYVGQTLTIRGTKDKPAVVEDHASSLRNERRFGSFCRNVDLPGSADLEQLSATCRGGVLELIIQKSETCRPKSIKIQADENE